MGTSVDNMLFLTKTFGPQFQRTDRVKRGVYEKLRSEYFPYGSNNWLTTPLLYSPNKLVGKCSECYRNVLGKLSSIFVNQYLRSNTAFPGSIRLWTDLELTNQTASFNLAIQYWEQEYNMNTAFSKRIV